MYIDNICMMNSDLVLINEFIDILSTEIPTIFTIDEEWPTATWENDDYKIVIHDKGIRFISGNKSIWIDDMKEEDDGSVSLICNRCTYIIDDADILHYIDKARETLCTHLLHKTN